MPHQHGRALQDHTRSHVLLQLLGCRQAGGECETAGILGVLNDEELLASELIGRAPNPGDGDPHVVPGVNRVGVAVEEGLGSWRDQPRLRDDTVLAHVLLVGLTPGCLAGVEVHLAAAQRCGEAEVHQRDHAVLVGVRGDLAFLHDLWPGDRRIGEEIINGAGHAGGDLAFGVEYVHERNRRADETHPRGRGVGVHEGDRDGGVFLPHEADHSRTGGVEVRGDHLEAVRIRKPLVLLLEGPVDHLVQWLPIEAKGCEFRMRGWGNVLSHAVRLHLAFPVLPGLLSRRFLLPPFWQRLNGLFHVKHSGRRRGDVRDNDVPHGCLVEWGRRPSPVTVARQPTYPMR